MNALITLTVATAYSLTALFVTVEGAAAIGVAKTHLAQALEQVEQPYNCSTDAECEEEYRLRTGHYPDEQTDEERAADEAEWQDTEDDITPATSWE